MKASLYDASVADCLGYLLRRLLLLAAKLCGFKGFCLFLATLLLGLGRVSEDVWLTLAVTLVCSASGIRVLDSFKEGADALDAKSLISSARGKYAFAQGGAYEMHGNSAAGAVAPHGMPGTGPLAGGSAGSGGACGGLLGAQAASSGSGGGAGAFGAAGPCGGASGKSRRKAARTGGRISSAAGKSSAARAHDRIGEALERAARLLD